MSIPSLSAVRDALIVPPGDSADLSKRPTRHPDLFADKDDAKESLEDDAEAIGALQEKLFAAGEQSLLVVLQGMDSAGKSGTIGNVFARTTPLGVRVAAFKAPSKRELARDFLWRIHREVPARGVIGVFDRSHYEDVLVVKVRGLAPPDAIEARYGHINAFEALLSDTGTRVLKLMLHLGHEEQGERLQERLDDPDKRWKHNPGDHEDRELWPAFMDAYETALTRCSTPRAPWHVVPADSRKRRNALAARLVRGALEEMTGS